MDGSEERESERERAGQGVSTVEPPPAPPSGWRETNENGAFTLDTIRRDSVILNTRHDQYNTHKIIQWRLKVNLLPALFNEGAGRLMIRHGHSKCGRARGRILASHATECAILYLGTTLRPRPSLPPHSLTVQRYSLSWEHPGSQYILTARNGNFTQLFYYRKGIL